jgi:TrmH family RNA methyltransferase
MRRITSRQNPAVARYRAAARGGPEAALLLDGVHLVSEAIDAGVRIQQAAVANEAIGRGEVGSLVDRLERAGAEVVAVSAPVMNAMSPVKSPSGIVALAARPACGEDRIYAGSRPLVLMAVDVQDPGNVGAIVRVAEAGGATGVVVAGASADPFGWRALRGSMGSAFRLPLAVRRQSPFDDARRHGCRVVAAVPRDGRSAFDLDLTQAVAIVIGGEGAGLPAAVLEAADDRVSVPMQAPVESLNAAVTAALIVYEARRQRAGASRTEKGRQP